MTTGSLVTWAGVPKAMSLPSSSTATRSARAMTAATSCSTSTIVTPVSFTLRSNQDRLSRSGPESPAIEQSRGFLTAIIDNVRATQAAGGALKDAFEACHAALSPTYGHWPIFEHTLPFDVARTWEELQGVDRPTIWTTERDQEIWAQLQG